MRREEFTFLLLLLSGTNAQFGEIASLATSLLGGALGNGAGIGALAGAGAAGAGAAGQAGGALAQIGQLYQLAQGALQLTGTGVGVLNQASEGNWFPAVLEQTAKNSQALMKQGGGNGLNLGALGPAPGKTAGGIGPEFGTSFPAPNIDDYDENAEIPGVTEKKTPKAPDGLVDIEDEDYEIETTKATTTTTEAATTTTTTELFPDEEEEETTETTTPPPRQIRIQLPDKDGKEAPEEELDYEDLINKKSEISKPVIPTIDAESTDEIKRNIIARGAKTQPVVPKLDKLVEVLQKSKLSKEEIDEIVAQVEGNRHIEKPAKYDFNAAVQNIPDKKNTIRQKITDASRIINSNFENQRKEQTYVIQKQVDEFKTLPDLTDINIATLTTTPKTTIIATSTTTTRTTTTTPTSTPTTTPASTTALPTSSSKTTVTVTQKRVQQARSVPAVNPTVAPLAPQVAPQVVSQVAHQFPQPAPPHPLNNFLLPQNHFQQPFHQQQQLYYTQAPFYGQQTQNYWGQPQQQNQYNQQYGLQPHQQQQAYQQQHYGYTTPYPTQQPQTQPQQPQQQFYNQQYIHQQQVQQPQPQQPQQYQQQYIPQQPRPQTPQPSAQVQQRVAAPSLSQQVVYRQGSAKPTVSPPRPVAQNNPNQVFHYYNDGQQIVQQIIPKRIAANGKFPLTGPFQSYSAATVDPTEYERRQKELRQAYHQPQTRGTEAQGHPRVQQPAARVKPRIYESTVTATGHRQAHAIRTYQATKSASVAPPNLQPAAATRSSGRVSAGKRRYSGHVLPGPTIDHRSLLEKRTTAKPRYVRVP